MKQSIFITSGNLQNNPLWCWVGRVLYYVCWPLIWLMISLSPKRARVLLVCNGKLLLTHDWIGPGKWSIPGGGLHRGEDERIGAVRELEEETGILLKISKLQLLGDITVVNNLITTNLVLFKVEARRRPEVVLSGIEILDFAWVDAKQIKTMKLDKSAQQILETFASDLNLVH